MNAWEEKARSEEEGSVLKCLGTSTKLGSQQTVFFLFAFYIFSFFLYLHNNTLTSKPCEGDLEVPCDSRFHEEEPVHKTGSSELKPV